jgi:hypothetical protein
VADARRTGLVVAAPHDAGADGARELRAQALRRSVRLGAAVVVAAVTWAASHSAANLRQARVIAVGGAVLLALLALVEVGSALAIRPVQAAQPRLRGLRGWMTGWPASLGAAVVMAALGAAQFLLLRAAARP